jgi:hypothetical protein
MNSGLQHLKNACSLLHYIRQNYLKQAMFDPNEIDDMIKTIEEIYHQKKDTMYDAVLGESND